MDKIPNLFSLFSFMAVALCFSLSFLVIAKPKTKYTISFSKTCFLIGIWTAFPFVNSIAKNESQALFFSRLVYIAASFVPHLFFRFILMAAEISEDKVKTFYKFSLVCAILFALSSQSALFIKGIVSDKPYFAVIPGPIYLIFVLYFGLSYCYTTPKLLQVYFNSRGYKRNQIRYILVAFLFAFIGGTMHFLPAYGIPEIFPHDIFILMFPSIIAYAIVKHRLMDISIAFTRTTIFLLVYTLVLGIPFAAAMFFKNKLSIVLGAGWWMLPLILMAVLATAGPFVYIYLERKAEDALLREQRRYQSVLKQTSVGMTRIRNLKKLLSMVVNIVTKTVKISHAAVYLYNKDSAEYLLAVSRNFDKSSIHKISADNPLISYLNLKHEPFVYEEIKFRMQETSSQAYNLIEENMRNLCASVIIPSFLEDNLLGFFVLGEKLSGQIYTLEDLNVFQVLASQAAMAIENARFYEETKEMQEQISQAEKMATIGTMADGLSHQINNRFYALSLIAGDSIDTIKITDTTNCSDEVKNMIKEVGNALERIQANVLQGGEVVRGMLKYTRKGEEGLEPVELNALLDNTLEMVQFKVNLSEIDLIRNFSNIPKIKGNLTQLSEVFFNLIDNAYESVLERCSALKEVNYRGKITISAKPNSNNMLEISLEDNGMGMKEETLPKVFTPFFTTKSSARKGTGLGLYVIKRLVVEMHKGKISFESTHKIGTKFTLELPIAK